MTITSYSPVLHASAGKLRVTSQNIKGHLRLRSVQFRNEIQQSFSNTYALIIRQHNQPTHPIIPSSHPNMDNRDKRYRSALTDRGITPRGRSQGTAQIVILPKHLPQGTAAPINIELNGRPNPFFRSNTIVSVQNTQSGSNQSTTS
jgi:hypothetical protein